MRYLAFRDGRQTLRFFMEKTWAVNFFLGPGRSAVLGAK